MQSTKTLRSNGVSTELVQELLSKLNVDSAVWPRDEQFRAAWMQVNAYERFGNSNLVYILQQINRSYSSTKREDLYIRNRLTVEHIMPQSWLENWPLQAGSQRLTVEEILDTDSTNHRAIAGRQRYDLVHTFGYFLLLTQSLNAEISNGSWHEKKTEIQNKSLLPIN